MIQIYRGKIDLDSCGGILQEKGQIQRSDHRSLVAPDTPRIDGHQRFADCCAGSAQTRT